MPAGEAVLMVSGGDGVSHAWCMVMARQGVRADMILRAVLVVRVIHHDGGGIGGAQRARLMSWPVLVASACRHVSSRARAHESEGARHAARQGKSGVAQRFRAVHYALTVRAFCSHPKK